MTVDAQLLEMLVCSVTKQRLKPAAPDVLERINAAIRAGELRNRGGRLLTKPITEALVREDGRVVYPIDEGTPVMVAEESISLERPLLERQGKDASAAGPDEE